MASKRFRGWKTNCKKCNSELAYTVLGGMNSPHVVAYSKCGHAALYSEVLIDKFDKSVNIDQDADTLLSQFERQLGNIQNFAFSMTNELRCPRCSSALTDRTGKKPQHLVNRKDVFLDGMIYVSDEGTYIVEVLT